jgi:hypothetical protein
MKILHTRTRCVAALTFSAALALNSTFAQSEKSDGFALRFPVQMQSSAGLQRLTLPPVALAAVQANNFADVRVFNGNGEAVPIAFLPHRAETTTAAPRNVSIYPINVTQKDEQNIGSLQLRIDERAGRRIVTVDGVWPNAVSSSQTKVIGALLDSKSITAKLDALVVDAELPMGEPVSLSVSASKDLKNWRSVAEAPVFRFGGDNAPGNLRVPLGGMSFDKEYLRVTWPSNAAIKLRGVQFIESPTVTPMVRSELLLAANLGTEKNELIVPVPFATPLHALDLRAAAPNTLVPVRVHARNAKNEPWRFVASNVIYRIASGNSEAMSPPIELNGLVARELKLEADRNPAAFSSSVPTVRATVNPVSVAFVASGHPPFTLAVGNKDAKPVALPLLSVIPGYVDGNETKLAQATVDVANAIAAPIAPPTVLASVKEKVGAPSERSLVLWGVLIAGVLLLGGLAWSLLRSAPKKDA